MWATEYTASKWLFVYFVYNSHMSFHFTIFNHREISRNINRDGSGVILAQGSLSGAPNFKGLPGKRTRKEEQQRLNKE